MTNEVVEVVKSYNDQMQSKFNELQASHDQLNEHLRKSNDLRESDVKKIKNIEGDLSKLAEQVSEMREKGVPLHSPAGQKSFIDLVGENDSYKAFKQGNADKFSIEVKKGDLANMLKKADVTGDYGSNADNNGLVMSNGLVQPYIDPTLQLGARRGLIMRDLIPTIQISSNAYSYFREKQITSGAAYVAEGEVKPQMQFTLEEVAEKVKKLAVWIAVTDEVLDDVPQMQGYIRQLLTYDLRDVEDHELLFGDGQNGRIEGFMQVAADYDSARWGEGTPLDVLRFALSQAAITSKIRPDSVVLSEVDWARLETYKDNNNRYIFGNPQGIAVPLIWGRPVVENIEMYDEGAETGRFLVGNFGRTSSILDRMTITVETGMINDQFIKNQRTILAEERIGLAIRRPDAFVKGTFDPKTAAA